MVPSSRLLSAVVEIPTGTPRPVPAAPTLADDRGRLRSSRAGGAPRAPGAPAPGPARRKTTRKTARASRRSRPPSRCPRSACSTSASRCSTRASAKPTGSASPRRAVSGAEAGGRPLRGLPSQEDDGGDGPLGRRARAARAGRGPRPLRQRAHREEQRQGPRARGGRHRRHRPAVAAPPLQGRGRPERVSAGPRRAIRALPGGVQPHRQRPAGRSATSSRRRRSSRSGAWPPCASAPSSRRRPSPAS